MVRRSLVSSLSASRAYTTSRTIQQHATAAPRHDHQALPGVARGGDAVMPPADPAMQAFQRFSILIDADQQPVGARRRPGLLDPERLDRAELHRLVAMTAGGERGRNPEAGRDGLHHVLAEIILAQHELDQMRAHGEDAEPEPPPRRS